MKKALLLLLSSLIVALCGCSVKQAPTLETIVCPAEPAAPAFYLSVDLPRETMLVSSADEGRCVVFSAEDYLVTEEIFAADSLDDALLRLTGREDIEVLTVSSFPQKEYRFAWTAAEDAGAQACSAALFYDGSFYYALTVQCSAEAEKEYRTVFSDLLSCAELEAV